MMNAPAPYNIPALLKQHNLQPNHSLGQNFLVDEAGIDKVIRAAEITADESVLEVGAGLGSLTRHLALHARRVVAVELDARLIPLLQKVLLPFPNVAILEGDILRINPAEQMGTSRYAVVSNIPYYITSILIRHLLEAQPQPDRLILTVQSEVAERICAAPGEMSLLALSVQIYGTPQVRARIPAGAFYPSPKVDSAVIRVDLLREPRIVIPQIGTFFRLARAGFSQKRKTLRNALSGGMAWSKEQTTATLLAAGIDPMRRAETLSIEEWAALTSAVHLGLDE